MSTRVYDKFMTVSAVVIFGGLSVVAIVGLVNLFF